MKLNKMSKEELEILGYDELAELILTEKGCQIKIVDIFKEISQLLEMSETEFENKIADFFQLISTDKRFIVLEKGFCDLRKKNTPTLIIEENKEDMESESSEEEEKEELTDENNEEDIFYDNSSEEDDVDDDSDELSDFIVVDEDETSM